MIHTARGSASPSAGPAGAHSRVLVAAEAFDGDLVGLDLLPAPDDRQIVLKVNDADFTATYS